MQPPALQSAIDRLPSHPTYEQLPPRNDPVLALCKPRNHLVPRTSR